LGTTNESFQALVFLFEEDLARIYLFDTMFQIYRAFHALPPLSGPGGIPTNAVHGVVGILSNLWRSERIRHLACVFESKTSGFRGQLDPHYKAQRSPMKVDMASQVPLVEEGLQALGITIYRHDSYEADDVLATLAAKGAAAGHEMVIVSNDKDLAQMCVHPKISVLRIKGSGKNTNLEYIDHSRVEALFGVKAELIASYLALNGDTVDNIPGIPGIGPKTACKLLNLHGPLPGLLDHALQEHRERALLNFQLTQLHQDLPIEFSLEALTPGNFQGLEAFYRKLGMKKQLASLDGGLFDPPNSLMELWS